MFYTEHDLFRPVDWRYRRAEWLRSKGRYSRRGRDDQYTILAKKFLARKEKCDSELDEEKLAREMPGIYYAFSIYHRLDADDRYTIEARVLANQPVEVIAARQTTSPEVVFWFEKLFFDVREKLHARDWVINRVLGPAIHRGIAERDFDLLLKLYALIGGAYVVDAMVCRTSGNIVQPNSTREVPYFWNSDQSDQVRYKAAITMRCIPINSHTQQAILETYGRLLQMERENASATDVNSMLLENLQGLLQAVPFHTPSKRLSSPRLRDYDALGVELRADELIAAGTGGVLPSQEDLTIFRFPHEPESVSEVTHG